MDTNQDSFEIIFFARGGQGAKVAAEIIAQAAFREGKFVQAFPHFGPERTGAPTRTYVRISEKPIRNHEPIVDPDAVVVLDDTLLLSQKVCEHLDENESLIVNTQKSREEVAAMFTDFKGQTYPIDASSLSAKVVGSPRPNTSILGKLIKVTEIVKIETIIEEFRKIFENKIGKAMTEKNIQAIQEAYDNL
jgi:pyruvate ferredoxin oxidoreductase gamma subunit